MGPTTYSSTAADYAGVAPSYGTTGTATMGDATFNTTGSSSRPQGAGHWAWVDDGPTTTGGNVWHHHWGSNIWHHHWGSNLWHHHRGNNLRHRSNDMAPPQGEQPMEQRRFTEN